MAEFGEWTSVKDALPEKPGMYLVTPYNALLKKPDISVDVYFFDKAKNWWDYANGTRYLVSPVAWMPLPKPYKASK